MEEGVEEEAEGAEGVEEEDILHSSSLSPCDTPLLSHDPEENDRTGLKSLEETFAEVSLMGSVMRRRGKDGRKAALPGGLIAGLQRGQ